jgi:drug/metabolite transporter (DMT)-like permease
VNVEGSSSGASNGTSVPSGPPPERPDASATTTMKALAPPKRPSGLLSLFLTGMADVWSATRTGVAKRGDLSGLLYMVVSAASFASMAACVKAFLPGVPTHRTVFWRGVVMGATFFCIARARGIDVRGKKRGRLVLRGLLGTYAVICYFVSVQRLPIGDAVLIQYSHPVFVAVLAPIVLREKTGRGHWLWVTAAFSGVWLVVGAGFGGGDWTRALVGLTGALLSGVAYMTVRDLARTDNPWTILVWFSIVMAPVSAAHALLSGVSLLPSSFAESGGHLAMIAAGLVGQFTLTQGLVRAGAARATAVSMSGPVFGLLLDFLIDGRVPAWTSVLGTAVVVFALASLALNRPKA